MESIADLLNRAITWYLKIITERISSKVSASHARGLDDAFARQAIRTWSQADGRGFPVQARASLD